ncbi:MAG: cyclase family protein [Candidatus Woesearchaeota archaeon]
MKFFDITQSLDKNMVMYRNRSDLAPGLHRLKDIEKGDKRSESRLALYLHSGTHFAAPKHVMKQGRDVTSIPIEACYGPCRVLDLTSVQGTIMPAHLKDVKKGERIILKTRNSTKGNKNYDKEFASMSKEAAEFLGEKETILLGLDAWTLERDKENNAYKALFRANCAILLGCVLKEIKPGDYTLSAFPLMIPGAEGTPVRAVLMREK